MSRYIYQELNILRPPNKAFLVAYEFVLVEDLLFVEAKPSSLTKYLIMTEKLP
jgi:hypothetical protein